MQTINNELNVRTVNSKLNVLKMLHSPLDVMASAQRAQFSSR